MHTHPHIHLHLHLSTHISLYLSIYIYLSICLFIYLPICLSFHLSVYLSIYLYNLYIYIYISIYLSTYLPIYLYVVGPYAYARSMLLALPIKNAKSVTSFQCPRGDPKSNLIARHSATSKPDPAERCLASTESGICTFRCAGRVEQLQLKSLDSCLAPI